MLKHIFVSRRRARTRGARLFQDVGKSTAVLQKIWKRQTCCCFFFSPRLWHFASLSLWPPPSCEASSAGGQDANRGDDEHFRLQVSALASAHGGRCLKAEEREEKKESSRRKKTVQIQPRGGKREKGKLKMWLLPGRGKYQLDGQVVLFFQNSVSPSAVGA